MSNAPVSNEPVSSELVSSELVSKEPSMSTPLGRWQHAMMSVAHDDVIPTMSLSESAVEGDAPDRTEFVDRSGVAVEIVPHRPRRRLVRRFLRLLLALVVLVAVAAGVVLGSRAVLDRIGSAGADRLFDDSRQESVGPIVLDVPRGTTVRDCEDSNRGRVCTHWELVTDDTVFVVRVADLGMRADRSSVSAAARAAAGSSGSLVDNGSLTETTIDGRPAFGTTATFAGATGPVTVLPMGRWSVTVLAVGDDSLTERHDEVLSSVRRS